MCNRSITTQAMLALSFTESILRFCPKNCVDCCSRYPAMPWTTNVRMVVEILVAPISYTLFHLLRATLLTMVTGGRRIFAGRCVFHRGWVFLVNVRDAVNELASYRAISVCSSIKLNKQCNFGRLGDVLYMQVQMQIKFYPRRPITSTLMSFQATA